MITEAIIIASVTAFATVTSQILISNRANSLVVYRIDQLEEKVQKHNNVIERLYIVEECAKSISRRLENVERLK